MVGLPLQQAAPVGRALAGKPAAHAARRAVEWKAPAAACPASRWASGSKAFLVVLPSVAARVAAAAGDQTGSARAAESKGLSARASREPPCSAAAARWALRHRRAAGESASASCGKALRPMG